MTPRQRRKRSFSKGGHKELWKEEGEFPQTPEGRGLAGLLRSQVGQGCLVEESLQ